jgi:hypothetical protein
MDAFNPTTVGCWGLAIKTPASPIDKLRGLKVGASALSVAGLSTDVGEFRVLDVQD